MVAVLFKSSTGAKLKKLSKHKSIGVATLKTLGTQYSMYSDMLRQVSALYTDFDSELSQALSLVHQKTIKPQEQKNNAGGSTTSDVAQFQDNETNAGDSSTNADNTPDQEQSSTPWLKKLFKRIAIHCHPDKVIPSNFDVIEKHQRMVSYDKARTALDNDNEPLMISVGLLYDELADVGIRESKRILADGVKELESDLNSKQSSLVWSWGMSEDNLEVKSKILIHAAAQFYNIELSSAEALTVIKEFFEIYDPKKRRKIGEHPGSRLKTIRNGRK